MHIHVGSNGHRFLLHHGDRDAGVCISHGIRAGLGSQDPEGGVLLSPQLGAWECPLLQGQMSSSECWAGASGSETMPGKVLV